MRSRQSAQGGALSDPSVSTTSTRRPRPPTPVITWRSALAVRPPRPMTLPRSSGCTRISRVLPRRLVSRSTVTSSGWSTMPLTRCSSASSSTSYSAGVSAGAGVSSAGASAAGASWRPGSLGGSGLGGSLGSSLLRRRLLLGGGRLGGRLVHAGADGGLVEGLLVRLGLGDAHGRRRGLALELLPVAGHPEDGGDGLGRLGADAEPVLRPLGVDLDEGGLLLRVVLADRLDRAAVTLGPGVGDDDAVVRRAHLAQAHELDLGGHGGWCTPRTLSRLLAGAACGGTPGRSDGHGRQR